MGHLSAAACFSKLLGCFPACVQVGDVSLRAEPSQQRRVPLHPHPASSQGREGTEEATTSARTNLQENAPQMEGGSRLCTNTALGWCLDPEQREAPGEAAGAVGRMDTVRG